VVSIPYDSIFTLLCGIFTDTLIGHTAFVIYLFAIMDHPVVSRQLRKLPALLVSPLTAAVMSTVLFVYVPEFRLLRMILNSGVIMLCCTLWIRWAWNVCFLQAFSTACICGIFQVTSSSFGQFLLVIFRNTTLMDPVIMGIFFPFIILSAILLKKLRFGTYFELLLKDTDRLFQTTMLMFALVTVVEMFFHMHQGIPDKFLATYYLLNVALILLITELILNFAKQIAKNRKIQVQQDIIAQQQLYEQNLEEIRQEVRAFRHDYKNLLAGLAQQANAGQLQALGATLSELELDFDRRLGEKIQTSTQIGYLQIPEIRSFILTKLTSMHEKKLACHLEVLYPVTAVSMNVWDLIRCLGILTDNAIEAALETDRPWIDLILLAQEERLSVRIANPFTNTLEPQKMWEEGWSTKGDGRGEGLASYQRILAAWPNAVSSASWENGVFVQELTILNSP